MQWRLIAPHLPEPRAMGRPREWPMREIVNGIFYVMRSGCPWRLVPSDLPPWGTISSETARIGMHGANIAIVCGGESDEAEVDQVPAGNRAAQRKTCDQPSYCVEVNLNN